MSPPNNGRFTEQESIEVTEVHGDLSQQVVKITVDKLSLILHKHAASIEERKGWIAPLGILITVLVVLVTSNFKNVIWPADTWAAIFIFSAVLSFIWLVKASWKAFHSESIDDLVDKIKKQE
jgi:hypothetical protein